jgi:hypothetical protein
MTDRRFNRLRMPAEWDARESKAFAGLPSRPAPPATLERAHRASKRTWEGRKLAKKLDELLGTVDQELPTEERE